MSVGHHDRVTSTTAEVRQRPATVSVAGIAVLLVVVLLALSGRYGYHRDELYFRVAGQHPAWGYVDQPFMTPMLARVGIAVFGDSPTGLRVLPALLAGSTVLIVALLARELRAGPTAQVLAAFAAVVSAMVLQGGHMLSTPTTDVLAWLVISLLVVRMLRCAEPRWWVPIGLVSGLAVDNKLTVGILLGAITVTLPVVGPRVVLRSWWLPVGAVLAVLVALPTIGWQVVHDFPQGRVASSIADDDGFTDRVLFVPMQLVLLGPLIVPLCVAGWCALWRDSRIRYARLFAPAYLLAAVVVIVAGGKFYYTAGLLLVLMAAGAQPVVEWARTPTRRRLLVAGSIVTVVSNAVIALPVLPVGLVGIVNPVNKEQGEQVAWPEFAAAVDSVWSAIPADQRERAVVVTANYGEAGAIDRFDPGLPVYSGHMSYYDWGPPPDARTGPVLLIDHLGDTGLRDLVGSCSLAARFRNHEHLDNDEDGVGIWRCDPPHEPWSQVWPRFRHT